MKNSDPKVEVSAAFEVISSATDTGSLKQWVKKLVAMIPSGKDRENDDDASGITESELIDSLKRSNEEVNKMIAKNILEVNNKLK